MAYRDCPHTPGVMCDSRSECRWCGWHPKEIERRKKMIDAGHLSTTPWGNQRLRVKRKAAPEVAVPKAAQGNNLPTI